MVFSRRRLFSATQKILTTYSNRRNRANRLYRCIVDVPLVTLPHGHVESIEFDFLIFTVIRTLGFKVLLFFPFVFIDVLVNVLFSVVVVVVTATYRRAASSSSVTISVRWPPCPASGREQGKASAQSSSAEATNKVEFSAGVTDTYDRIPLRPKST